MRTVQLPALTGPSLYLNPAAVDATLVGATPGVAVQVLDVLGRVVTTTQADAAGTAQLPRPAGQGPGVYLVRTGATALRLTLE